LSQKVKAQLYGHKLPLWQANKMWRAARNKTINADLQRNQILSNAVFAEPIIYSHQKNNMVIKQALQRVFKSA